MTGISYYAGKADCAQIMGGTNHHLSGHNNENCFGESCFWNLWNMCAPDFFNF